MLEGLLRPLDQLRRVGVLEVVGYEDSLPAASGYLFDHVAASLLVAASNDDPGPGDGEASGTSRPIPEVEPVTSATRPLSMLIRTSSDCITTERSIQYYRPVGL